MGDQLVKVPSLGEAGDRELSTYYVLGKIPSMKSCFFSVMGPHRHSRCKDRNRGQGIPIPEVDPTLSW